MCLITETMDHFLAIKKQNASESSFINYQQRAKYFLHFIEQSNLKHSYELSKEATRNYINHINTLFLSSNTRYVALQLFKEYMSFLAMQNILLIDYSNLVTLPQWKRHTKPPIPIEKAIKYLKSERVTQCFSLRDQAIGALGLLEHLSAPQMMMLHVFDLCLETQILRIHAKKSIQKPHAQTLESLTHYLKERSALKPQSDYLFISSKNGRRLEQQNISKIIKRIKES